MGALLTRYVHVQIRRSLKVAAPRRGVVVRAVRSRRHRLYSSVAQRLTVASCGNVSARVHSWLNSARVRASSRANAASGLLCHERTTWRGGVSSAPRFSASSVLCQRLEDRVQAPQEVTDKVRAIIAEQLAQDISEVRQATQVPLLLCLLVVVGIWRPIATGLGH